MNHLQFSGLPINIFDVVNTTIPPLIIFLAGLVAVIGAILYYIRRKRARSATIRFSDVRIVKRAGRTRKQRFRFVLTGLRVLAVALLFVALARPRSGTRITEETSEGIDIMMALDVSSSMQADDFKPYNRLWVAKDEVKKFISARANDRIGLVVFAANSFTQCPLTTDYGVLLTAVDEIDFGALTDGTAIGMAIANGVNRLRDSNAKSKIMILLSDGSNNAGEIDPLTAANLAAAFDIKIYTIAAAKPGYAMVPIRDPLFGTRYISTKTDVDEETLKEIAARTGGKYFRARSSDELDQIYNLINRLEKTEVKTTTHTEWRELFQYFAYAGFLLLVVEMVLGHTYFRKLP